MEGGVTEKLRWVDSTCPPQTGLPHGVSGTSSEEMGHFKRT